VSLEGYAVRSFEAPLRGGTIVSHDVYERGAGPPVVIIQELPGIGPETLALADRLVARGFSVALPHLFGPLGRISMLGNMVRVFCMRREFRVLEKHQSSPVVDWLRALCRDIRDRTGAAGVGTIGMCLTGNFAITLMADDSVLAGVASQPSMPLFGEQTALHMSDAEIEAARTGIDANAPIMALRFAEDSFCQAAKFDAIQARFNADGTERVRMTTLPGKGHSVLTLDFVDEQGHPTHDALNAVLDYLDKTLGVGAPSGAIS
jgi:dienelactone hydrolase